MSVTTGFLRAGIKANNVTATSFAVTDGAVLSRADMEALAVPQWSISGAELGHAFRAADFLFTGTAADNTAHDYILYGAFEIPHVTPKLSSFMLFKYITGTFTFSTKVGVQTDQGPGVLTSERFADTVTITTVHAFLAKAIIDEVGMPPSVHSPINNTGGMLSVPELYKPQRLIMDLKAGSGSINALARLKT